MPGYLFPISNLLPTGVKKIKVLEKVRAKVRNWDLNLVKVLKKVKFVFSAYPAFHRKHIDMKIVMLQVER